MDWEILRLFSNYIDQAKNLSRKDKEQLYEIVIIAIRRTRTFITQTRINGKDEPSNILSLTWQSAANRLRRFDNDELKSFAATLEQKSKYWSEPSSYTVEQIQKYGMLLTEVEDKLNELTK